MADDMPSDSEPRKQPSRRRTRSAAENVAASADTTRQTRSGSETRKRGLKPVLVRLLPEERTELERRAGGLSLAAFFRECALGSAGPRARRSPTVDRELLARNNAELNRVGNNVNQIARELNRGRDPDPAYVDEVLTELLAVLALNRKALGYDRQG